MSNKQIENTNDLFEILDSIQNHIRLQDTKAAGLLTVIGIIFSFSMISIDTIFTKTNNARITIYIVGGIYLLFFLVSVVLLIISLFPMRRKENKDFLYSKYAIDVYKMTKNENFKELIKKEISEEDILTQIKACSKIAFIKENCVRVSAFTIATSVFLLLAIIILIIVL